MLYERLNVVFVNSDIWVGRTGDLPELNEDLGLIFKNAYLRIVLRQVDVKGGQEVE